jgi:hypothetical protein
MKVEMPEVLAELLVAVANQRADTTQASADQKLADNAKDAACLDQPDPPARQDAPVRTESPAHPDCQELQAVHHQSLASQ